MAKITDVFQLVACLPNLPEKEFKTGISERVTDSLSILDKVQPKARKEYQQRLSRRARHHKVFVDRIAKRFSGSRGIIITSNKNEQLVRDFYHNGYYAAFFVARFALVSSGGHDCTGHAVIGTALKDIVKRSTFLGQPPNTVNQNVTALAQIMSDWREYRDVADYIMNENKLSALANPQTIALITSELQSLFATWNVP